MIKLEQLRAALLAKMTRLAAQVENQRIAVEVVETLTVEKVEEESGGDS